MVWDTMKRRVVVSIFACLAVTAFQASCKGAVSRTELKQKVKAEIQEELLAALHTPVAATDRDRIEARSLLLSSAIDDLPSSTLDDGLAAWIKDSVASFITLHEKRLTLDDENAKSSIDEWTRVVPARLKTLTPDRGAKLLAERRVYVASEAKFRPQFDRFVFDQLRSQGRFKILTSGTAISGIFGNSVEGIVDNLAKVSHNGPLTYNGQPINADVSQDALMNQLLTRLLIYEVRSVLNNSDVAARYVDNLFAPVYDTDSVLLTQPRNFDSIKSALVERLQVFIRPSGDLCQVDLTGMVSFVLGSDYIRYGVKSPPDNAQAIGSRQEDVKSIVFKNDPNAWSYAGTLALESERK